MTPSKIEPHTIYAAELRIAGEKVLVRFNVTKVVTVQTRTGGGRSPHDYVSTVFGYVFNADLPKGVTLAPSVDAMARVGCTYREINPDAIQGLYVEVAALRQKQMEEDAARKLADAQANNRAVWLRRWLYRQIGPTVPDCKPDDVSRVNPIRAGYGNRVEMTPEAVLALYEALATKSLIDIQGLTSE